MTSTIYLVLLIIYVLISAWGLFFAKSIELKSISKGIGSGVCFSFAYAATIVLFGLTNNVTSQNNSIFINILGVVVYLIMTTGFSYAIVKEVQLRRNK